MTAAKSGNDSVRCRRCCRGSAILPPGPCWERQEAKSALTSTCGMRLRSHHRRPQSENAQAARTAQLGSGSLGSAMIRANLRLVGEDRAGLRRISASPLLDLINEGNIGPMPGLERFDPGEAVQTAVTYASWWIKQSAIKRAPANRSSKTDLRLPASSYQGRRACTNVSLPHQLRVDAARARGDGRVEIAGGKRRFRVKKVRFWQQRRPTMTRLFHWMLLGMRDSSHLGTWSRYPSHDP